MSLNEALFFLGDMPRALVAQLMIMQGLNIFVVAAFTPFFMGKSQPAQAITKPVIPITRESVKVFACLSVLYLMFYWVFGYYVAWQDAGLRAFYGVSEIVPFFEHTWNTAMHQVELPLFQLLRGLMWGAVAYLIVRMTGGKVAAPLLTGVAFAALMGTGLFLPNPYMPDEVRMVHMVEVFSSNFLYGGLAALIWQRHLRRAVG